MAETEPVYREYFLERDVWLSPPHAHGTSAQYFERGQWIKYAGEPGPHMIPRDEFERRERALLPGAGKR
jgi:hypothetical protein